MASAWAWAGVPPGLLGGRTVPGPDFVRLFGLVVARNEQHRYLASMLAKAMPLVDRLFLLDDRSDDDTAELALAMGCDVWVREPDAPSFFEHEGRFRQSAWESFEAACDPQTGDWVLALDTDEALVGANLVETLRYQLPVAAAANGVTGLRLHVAEVFGVAEGAPLVRVDGLWGSISGVRLFAYEPEGTFLDRAMGCGSAPTYVSRGKIEDVVTVALLHFGYLDPDDRLEKYERYAGRPGHNEAHVASILQPPALRPWTGHSALLRRAENPHRPGSSMGESLSSGSRGSHDPVQGTSPKRGEGLTARVARQGPGRPLARG